MDTQEPKTQRLPIAEIVELQQSRTQIDPDSLAQLAASMRQVGLINPIRVRWDDALQKYPLIAGHRRFRAGLLIGLTEIDAIVVEGADEATVLAQQIIENEQREDVSPGDLYRSVQRFKDLGGFNSKRAGEHLGISPSRMTLIEAYGDLVPQVQEFADAGQLNRKVIYALGRLTDPAAQIASAEAFVQGRLSTDALIAKVQHVLGGKRPRQTPGNSKRVVLSLGALSVTYAGEPTALNDLIAALDELRREVKRAIDKGHDLPALARSLRVPA